MEGEHDGACIPEIKARIPQELSRIDKFLRVVEIRLFRKRLHSKEIFALFLPHLNITVGRIGALCLYAHRQHRIVVRHKVQTGLHLANESSFIADELVAGRY